MRRAGTPTTSAWAGTSRLTTAPAPTKAYSPIVLPQTMVLLAPSVAPRWTRVRRYSALRGTVRVGGVAVNKIEHWEFDEPRPGDDEVRAASYQTTSVYGFGHPLYYANVIDTLRGEASAQVDGYEGLRSLEVVIAAYRSARDGVRVGLPLVF